MNRQKTRPDPKFALPVKAEPDNPTVSVILPVFNGQEHLAEAIESILSQTVNNFELILINDGSTDKTIEILQRYSQADTRIRLIDRENRGLVASLNEGLEAARGEYIARMDADDVSEPSRLQLQVEYLDRNPEVVLLGVRTFLSRFLSWRYIGITGWRACSWGLTFRNKIGHPGVMFRSELIKQYGLRYRTDYLYAEDFKLWCEMLNYGKVDMLPNQLLFYRSHGNSISKKYAVQQREIDRKIVSENLANRFDVDMSDVLNADQHTWVNTICYRVFNGTVFKSLSPKDKAAIHLTYRDYCVIYGVPALYFYIKTVGLSQFTHSGVRCVILIYRAFKHSLLRLWQVKTC